MRPRMALIEFNDDIGGRMTLFPFNAEMKPD
jgi:hypothetical protein